MKNKAQWMATMAVMGLGFIINGIDVHADTNSKLQTQTQLTQTNAQTNPQTNPDTTIAKLQTGNDSTKTKLVNGLPISTTAMYYNSYGYSHFTRYDLEHLQTGITKKNNPMPNLSQKKIHDVLSAKDTRKGVKGQPMNVWDSWPLQDANGNEVTFKGYHIVFALTGNPNKDKRLTSGTKVQDSRIFVYYQKVSDEKKGIQSWKCAGPLFNSRKEGTTGHDRILNSQQAQWSGQTVKVAKNEYRIFYTTFNATTHNDWQALATAKISLGVNKQGVYVNHAKNSDHRTLITPDGHYYQKYSQANNDQTDENVFRDAHYFTYHGKKYIIFAASAHSEVTGPENDSVLKNTAFLGGNNQFQNQQRALLAPKYATNDTIQSTLNASNAKMDDMSNVLNPWHTPSIDANAVIGVAQLDAHYGVKKVLKPILGLNTVTDEFERPNLFESHGKWYLFGITRGYKLATPNVKSTDSYLIGFVSDSPFGPFKPVNKHGLVLRNTKSWKSRDYDYSAYILNNHNHGNEFVTTSYVTNSKMKVGHQTFAPSMIVKIKGDKITVNHKVLNQGQLVK